MKFKKLTIWLFFITTNLFAQSRIELGNVSFNHKTFIQNSGQFDHAVTDTNRIFYMANIDLTDVFFRDNGVIYKFGVWDSSKAQKNKEDENNADSLMKTTYFKATWQDCNSNTQISPLFKQSFYHTYSSMPSTKVSEYGELLYKNLYDGIDVLYTIPKDNDGLEYSMIIKQGANINKIKILYQGVNNIHIDAKGNLIISTIGGNFMEYAPKAYLNGIKDSSISISYVINSGNRLGFKIIGWDSVTTLTIDPLVITPSFQHTSSTLNRAYDIDNDYAGNIYIYGGNGFDGTDYYQLMQYSSSGTLNWTCNVSMGTYGGFAVDKIHQISYVVTGRGSPLPSIIQVNSSGSGSVMGSLTVNYTNGTGTMYEMWRAKYDECTGNIVIGGGGENNATISGCDYSSYYYESAVLNPSTGSLNLYDIFGPASADEGFGYLDVSSVAIDPSTSECYMTIAIPQWTSIGPYSTCLPAYYNSSILKSPLPTLAYTASPGPVNDGLVLEELGSYYVGNSYYNANGFNGLTASPNYVYGYDGNNLKAYGKSGLTTLASQTVSGSGMSGGIDVDACDNVYVGSGNSVKIYNFNGTSFSLVTTISSLTGNVYDVKLENDNTVLICGNGFAESVSNPINGTNPVTITSTASCISGCTGTATASISLCGSPVSAAGYTWYNSSNSIVGTSATATGLCAGTYMVTVSLGGCTHFYTNTVTIAGTVSPPTVTASNNSSSQCVGAPVILSATGSGGLSPYVYSWAPSGGTTTSTSVTIPAPANNTVYTVTITGQLAGCSSTATTTVTVNPDCCYLSCGSPLTIPTGSSSGSYTTADFTNNSCISISGPGAFTIPAGTSFTITNCDIAMGDGASIVVVPTATLTIDNSRLYACGDMWQGIIVQGTGTSAGTLNINGTSSSPCIVEDAIQGVYMEGFVNISYGLLNNNLYDIYVPGSGTPILSLQSSTLTCSTDGTYSSNAYLKAPNLGALTNSGVYINNNNNIIVGDASSASYQNTFSYMHYGVNANNSDFDVYNNLFEYMAGYNSLCMASFFYHPCPAPIGIAVLANSTTPGSHNATVGGSGSNQGNTMSNCYRGVDITNYHYPDIEYNTMSNTTNTVCNLCSNASPYGDHGIYIKNPTYVVASNNYIKNFSTGIHLYGVFSNQTSAQYSHADYNTLLTYGTGSMNTGILAEDPSPINIGNNYVTLYIQHNGISNPMFAGIEINNGYKTPVFGAEVYINNNTIYIYPTATSNDGSQRSGILVQKSQGMWADDNYMTSIYTYLSSTPCRADTSVVGIKSIFSQGVYSCNTMYEVGQCIKFEGNCNPSTIASNSFEFSFDGFALESNGIIGWQPSGGGTPAGNTWQSLSSFLRSETYTYKSFANLSPMWVLNNSLELPSKNVSYPYTYSSATPYFAGPVTISTPPQSLYPATGTDISCPPAGGGFKVAPWLYRPLAAKMVQDSILYPIFISECQYMDKQTVFAQIKEDTDLMDSSTVLHSFYHVMSGSMSGTNIGKLYRVDSDITKGNYMAAQSVNNSFTPINRIETNQRLVNYVYLNTFAAGVDTLSVSQYDTLMNIASQCPFEGGPSVYGARALLNGLWNVNLVFIDSCNTDTSVHSPENRIANTQVIPTDNIQAKVYPNPANTMLNIEVNLQAGQTAYFEMYNNLGQLIENRKLNSQLTTLAVSNLPSGIYYYRITSQNGNILKADKQLLMH